MLAGSLGLRLPRAPCKKWGQLRWGGSRQEPRSSARVASTTLATPAWSMPRASSLSGQLRSSSWVLWRATVLQEDPLVRSPTHYTQVGALTHWGSPTTPRLLQSLRSRDQEWEACHIPHARYLRPGYCYWKGGPRKNCGSLGRPCKQQCLGLCHQLCPREVKDSQFKDLPILLQV